MGIRRVLVVGALLTASLVALRWLLKRGSETADEDEGEGEDEDEDGGRESNSNSDSRRRFSHRHRLSSIFRRRASPVPSTAGSEASGGSSEASLRPLSCSPSLDPYSEDLGLLSSSASGRTTPPASSLPRFRKYTVDDFHFLKLLGKGSFGKVLLAELRGTDQYYAVKCVNKEVFLEEGTLEFSLMERDAMVLGSKHPYICHLFCTFQTESHLLYVMEYLSGGDLLFHIQQSGGFAEPRARFYAAEIVSGLKFLHKKGIIHRDVKSENILMDTEGHMRIADYGMCIKENVLDHINTAFCGTPAYMAPEIIKWKKYGKKADWWSYGVVVFEMLVGDKPFQSENDDLVQLFRKILYDQPTYPRVLTREALALITSLLEKDEVKRLGSANDVCAKEFFGGIDWDALERRELPPPFRPHVNHPLDAASTEEEAVALSVVDSSIINTIDQTQFEGFTCTNQMAW